MTRTLSRIHTAAKAGRIRWRYHALLQAKERGISRSHILQVITQGEMIEQRLDATPFPKCLLMTLVEADRPLYVSVGYDAAEETTSTLLRRTGSTPANGKTCGHVNRRQPKIKNASITMTTTTYANQTRCGGCGGNLQATTITHEERRGSQLYLFQNVPALVCASCGEIWIEETTLQQIDWLITEGQPVRKQETPVFDLAFPSAQ